ncbi:unnamed protein product [Rotaria sordida]|uniref:TonB C-terminal domain-containing protein n=1 Tax=Rotaria sordida TaxID=392033 RepID=A0A813MUM2_9BILA|nr:unnamed protein product [Rotaria sordida]
MDKNLVYPPAARKAGTSGKVIVQVIITEKGVLKSAKVVKGIKGVGGEDCNKEALRLVGLLPKWQPATIDGKPVRMVTKLPVYFAKETVVKEINVDLSDINSDNTEVPPPPPPMEERNGDMVVDLPDNPDTKSDNDVFTMVEEMPNFPGGDDALLRYLGINIKYPDKAKDAGIQGTVYASFIVNSDGSITDAAILRGVNGPGGKECNDEALRVVKSMPKWIPGKQNAIILQAFALTAQPSKPKQPTKPAKVQVVTPPAEPAKTNSSGISLQAPPAPGEHSGNTNVGSHSLPEGEKSSPMVVEEMPTSVYSVVEVMPEYPGGDDSLRAQLARSVKYPEIAKDANTQGTIYVTYVVNEDGTVSDVKILRGLSGPGAKECNAEAIRVVYAMPKWKPGKQNGKPVRVQYNLPIKFMLR